jgi:hypothetical protein
LPQILSELCGALADEAANLVDRVLSNVPIRQWVLSSPWEIRELVATDRKVVGSMDRIFGEEIAPSVYETPSRAILPGASKPPTTVKSWLFRGFGRHRGNFSKSRGEALTSGARRS